MTDKFDLNWQREGYVSIWLGDFDSLDDFDDYLDEQYEDDDAPISHFAEDTGLGWYDQDLVESYMNEDEKRESIYDLIGPCSYSSSFVNAVIQSANKLGLKEAKATVLVFDCNYKKPETTAGPLIFVGSFPYKRNAPPAIE